MSNVLPLSLSSATALLDSSLRGWTLLDVPSEGDRTYVHEVQFERAFTLPPLVHIGISGLDVSKDDNVRLRVRASNITPTGFTIEASTWLNTKIWAVDVNWLAIGS